MSQQHSGANGTQLGHANISSQPERVAETALSVPPGRIRPVVRPHAQHGARREVDITPGVDPTAWNGVFADASILDALSLDSFERTLTSLKNLKRMVVVFFFVSLCLDAWFLAHV